MTRAMQQDKPTCRGNRICWPSESETIVVSGLVLVANPYLTGKRHDITRIIIRDVVLNLFQTSLRGNIYVHSTDKVGSWKDV